MRRVGALLRKRIAGRLETPGDRAVDTLFEAMPATLLVAASGRVLRANRAARACLPDASPGAAVDALFAAPQREAIGVALRSALAGNATLDDGMLPVVEADGTISAVLLQIARVGAETGSAEQRAAAQRLQALGQLVGGLAHDFNNLLTAIAAAADAAADIPGNASAEAARIREATARGAELTRRLLAFGRQQILMPRGVDANGAVQATARLLQRLMGDRIRIDLLLEYPGRSVHVDPTQLDQVLVNLAVNARDAMPDGGGLRLTTGHATLLRPLGAVPEPVPPGRWVTIAVGDTGSGIAPEILPHIFEPFFTTRSYQAGTTGGTGLGLATVHGILRQSGGYLAVQTALGAGTTMTIYLPRWDGVIEPADAVPAATHASGAGRTVLLVEDEDLIRTVAARTLTRRGWHVLAAESGEAALDLLTPDGPCPSAIVSDMVMPGMDGAALVRAARGRLAIADLPAILVSGYAAETQREAMAGLGAVFLPKPYAMQDLADRLAAVARPAGVG